MNNIKVPDGYRRNANGDLVRLENIKPIDLLRDELVNSIADRAREMSEELGAFRTEIMGDVETFVAASASRFKTKLGGTKGNLTLMSFDGQFKVVVANQDYITFDERLQIAKELIDKCIKKWSDGADAKLLALVNDAFQVDKAGKVSARRVLGLRSLDINDPAWKKAMDAISESIQVVASKCYLRVYERADNGEYRPIVLDVANV